MRLRFPPQLLLVPALAGCAAAPPPRGPEERPPATLDEALGRLDRAEADLDRLGFGGSPFAAPQPTGAAPSFAQPPAPPAEPATGATATPKEEPAMGADGEARSADPCQVACTALASMARSAEHVCGLTGDGDTRCDGARARVRTAQERVRARCPACTGG